MAEKLPDVWWSRDFPVLVEIVRRIDGGDDVLMLWQLAEALGRELDEVGLAVQALERRGFLRVGKTMGGYRSWHVTDIAGSAYLVTGLHPDGDELAERFISALRQAAERSTDDEERSTLRKVANGAAGISRDVFVGIVSSLVSHAAGA